MGFFSYQCQAIRAHGDYLYAQGRDGDTTIYDETLRAVRGGLADPYASFATLDGGVVDLSTGETLLSGFLFGAELGGGLLSVTDGEALGICDTSGRVLTDCVYAVSYTHLDVYKRQLAHGGLRHLKNAETLQGHLYAVAQSDIFHVSFLLFAFTPSISLCYNGGDGFPSPRG